MWGAKKVGAHAGPKSLWAQVAIYTWLTLLCPSACVRALPGETPPESARLYYPMRMALSADQSTAFIVNANFDQRFNTSWITQVDVRALLREASSADGKPMAALAQGLHVPALGGDLALAESLGRAYLTHRGSGLLTIMDISRDAGGKLGLSCGVRSGAFDSELTQTEAHTDCDRAHLMVLGAHVADLDGLGERGQARRYNDPYAVTTLPQPGGALVLVGYLQSGRITALHDDGRQMPSVLGFAATPADGIARLSAQPQGLMLAASHATMQPTPRADGGHSFIVSLALSPNDPGAPFVASARGVATQSYPLSQDLGGSPENPAGAPEVAGIVVSPRDGNRIFVLSRSPDALALMQLSAPPASVRADNGTVTQAAKTLAISLLGAESVAHSTLSDVIYVPRDAGDLLLVTSLVQDMIYVFDPTGDDLQLVHRMHLRSGQGPVALLHARVDGRDIVLVSTFFDHGLTVLDVSAVNFADFSVIASLHDENFPVAPRRR